MVAGQGGGRGNGFGSLLVPPAKKDTASESGLRGYDEKAWINKPVFKISISSIISHYFCPRCAFLAFRKRLYVNTLQSVEGQICHFAAEKFFAREVDFVQCSTAGGNKATNLFLNFLELLREDTENKFGYQYRKLGGDFSVTWNRVEYLLKRRFERLVLAPLQIIPERQFEISLSSDNLGLTGRLDVIENGAPLEIKTGYVPNNGYSLSHALQVSLYALLIENKHFVNVNVGYLYYFSADEIRVVNIDEDLRMEALYQRDAALCTFQNENEPEGKCRRCVGGNDT
ncbi:MAG TPA: CRISPR-associated protein Cas4 [Nitrososphaera sp.]|nr:CRISPR-associated protein Cas4 [Nitrososphaera sp.]